MDLLIAPVPADGPTVLLDCNSIGNLRNSTPDFMYFVPLISPVKVTTETSANNAQRSGLISCFRQSTEESFYVSCEFEMRGTGSHKTIFDSVGMIARNTPNIEPGDNLKNILGYIKFDGEGFGWIEMQGKISNGKPSVTQVHVHFNGREGKSPVTVGLYSVKSVNGKYEYANRYNQIVARVDQLIFTESTACPKMGIEISSLYREGGNNGFWGRVKAAIANYFIKPLEIDALGNDTMLTFGQALYDSELLFTFPIAKNLLP